MNSKEQVPDVRCLPAAKLLASACKLGSSSEAIIALLFMFMVAPVIERCFRAGTVLKRLFTMNSERLWARNKRSTIPGSKRLEKIVFREAKSAENGLFKRGKPTNWFV